MTVDQPDQGLSTRSIHAGWQPDPETAAVKRPLIMANSYVMPPDATFDDVPYIYARDLSPNAHWLEERLLALEGGEDCVVTASGVSAINGMFFALLSSGDHLIASEIAYVSVRTMLIEHLPARFSINVTLVDTSDPEQVRRAVTPETKLIHIETPGNPTTRISDIAAIAQIAHDAGALLSVDSTWSGLITQPTLDLGADLVIHSISKYINGHGDALGGAVLGSKDLIAKIRSFVVKDLGACISPFNAWQIMRGAATLPMRMERHCQNGMAVAEFLERHPNVAWVRYPGLASHPQHAIAVRQMSGYSGMLNFDIRDAGRRQDLLRKLRIFTHATSLGHDESLIMVYQDLEGSSFFRVSVGLEDAADLIADLDRALEF